jgi:hypothetical protein
MAFRNSKGGGYVGDNIQNCMLLHIRAVIGGPFFICFSCHDGVNWREKIKNYIIMNPL